MENHESALRAGTVIVGPERSYTIRKVLGQGGFGITYLVTAPLKVGNITVQCDFAVKELFSNTLSWRDGGSHSVCFSPTASSEMDYSLKSFIKEAQRLQTLGVDDPNIVKINEVFEANNTAYYVMEYLSGQTLEDYVQHAGRLSLSETDFFIKPIIRAVADLHRRQVTHYDIKPLNIILAESEASVRPVLIDFGLAKHYDHHGQATSTNRGGGYSPGYAPIEQYAGLTTFTPQADVYAIGATMYYCLTGKRPDEALTLRADQVFRDLEPLVPEHVARTIVRAMSLKPEDRQADASVLYSELYDQMPAQPTPPIADVSTRETMRLAGSKAEPAAPVPAHSRKPLIIGVMAAIALIIAGIVVFSISKDKKTGSELEPAVPAPAAIDSMNYAHEESNADVLQGTPAEASVTPAEHNSAPASETDQPKWRTAPRHLDILAIDRTLGKNSPIYCFSANDWEKLSTREKNSLLRPCGIAIIDGGLRFVIDLDNAEGEKGDLMSLKYANKHYGAYIPTKAQRDYIVSHKDSINKIIGCIDASGQITGNYWAKGDEPVITGTSQSSSYINGVFTQKTDTTYMPEKLRPVFPLEGFDRVIKKFM